MQSVDTPCCFPPERGADWLDDANDNGSDSDSDADADADADVDVDVGIDDGETGFTHSSTSSSLFDHIMP